MIPEQWYPIFPARRLRRRPVGVRRLDLDLVLWRDGEGRAVCMEDRCPHRGVALSPGRVRGGELECAYHGFRFDADGDCTRIPCEGPGAKIPKGMRVRRYPTREAYGVVWLFLTDRATTGAELPSIPWFPDFGGFRAGDVEGTLDWPMPCERSIESNFDVHHTPFLHRWLVPGVGPRVDPYEVEVEGSSIRTRGELRREGSDRGMAFRVDFVAPSVTLIAFGGVSFVVADCPVDAENTWRYVRYRTDVVRVPGLRWLIAWLYYLTDFRIAQLRQDLPMVLTQRPRHPDSASEHLVHADAGTAAYRKLRRHLLTQAEAALSQAS